MTLKATIIALPLIVAGTFVYAQDVRYLSYGASYNASDNDDVLALGGTLDYTNNGFIFNGGVTYASTDIDDLAALSLRVGYVIAPQIATYAGVTHQDDGMDDFTDYNIGAEYGVGPYTAGLTVSKYDDIGSGTAVAIYGGYNFAEVYEVSLIVENNGNETSASIVSDFDIGGTELFAVYGTSEDFNVFAVNGSQDLGNGFRVGAGYLYSNDDEDSFDAYSISGGYEASEDLWIDVGYSRATGGDDVISVAITFETGRETLLIDRAETAVASAFGVLGNGF